MVGYSTRADASPCMHSPCEKSNVATACTHLRQCAVIFLLLAAMFGAPDTLAAQATGVPPWRTRRRLWETTAEDRRPCREDQRLARSGEPASPDNFQVLFAS